MNPSSSSSVVSHVDCRGKILDLSLPCVMGAINITPDSFFAESRCVHPEQVLARAQNMVAEGAAIIDLGAEATSPQVSARVSVAEEIQRLIPAVKLLAAELPVPISVDTSKPEVMAAAIEVGAGFINDVRALRAPGALAVAAQADVPVCLMHMTYLDPATAPRVNDSKDPTIINTVVGFLHERIDAAITAGIRWENILIDPGFGNGAFGKSTPQNYFLLQQLARFAEFNLPLLVGLWRKTFIGDVTGKGFSDRLSGSLAAAAYAAWQGVRLFRVHDVGATVDALKVISAIVKEPSAW